MKKKAIIFLLFFFCFFLFFISTDSFARELEVSYPDIADEGVPTDTDIGLDAYIVYVFQLAMVLVGVAFFGALIYNGIKYMLSSGDPAKSGEAITGIKAAFLGSVILLFSVGILNTIDESFLTIDVKKPEEIDPARLAPGAYVCNFKLDDEGATTNPLLLREQIAEAQKEDPNHFCERIEERINEKFIAKENSYFVSPNLIKEEKYGAIFFSKEDGMDHAVKKPGIPCEIYIENAEDYYLDFEELPKVFEKQALSVYPIVANTDLSDSQKVTLYEGYHFNKYVPKNYPFFIKHIEEDRSDIINMLYSLSINVSNIEDEYDDFCSDFFCDEAGVGVQKNTQGIRSVEMSDNVFILFKEDKNCLILESSKKYLDELLPNKKYSASAKEERGFPTGIYFDKAIIVRGEIR